MSLRAFGKNFELKLCSLNMVALFANFNLGNILSKTFLYSHNKNAALGFTAAPNVIVLLAHIQVVGIRVCLKQ